MRPSFFKPVYPIALLIVVFWFLSSITWFISLFNSLLINSPYTMTLPLLCVPLLAFWCYGFLMRIRDKKLLNSDGFLLTALFTFYLIICINEFGDIVNIFKSSYLGMFIVAVFSRLAFMLFKISKV